MSLPCTWKHRHGDAELRKDIVRDHSLDPHGVLGMPAGHSRLRRRTKQVAYILLQN